jgi:HKD family nuclease
MKPTSRTFSPGTSVMSPCEPCAKRRTPGAGLPWSTGSSRLLGPAGIRSQQQANCSPLRLPSAPGAVVRALSERPSTPLSDAALLTNAPGEPGIGHEIRAELASADRVDVIMAFVKWYGLRLFEDQLRAMRESGVPLRVITTTYMGATERAALDRLVRDFGAQVKVQYDAQRTRLHAKAWLFRRNTGFDTAYVGSSNLSRAAMLDGVEWNVRLSSVSTPPLLQKFLATFDSYWNDATFETYDPDADRDKLDDALAEAPASASTTG